MIKEHTYLADAPEPFVRTCDVLLKLDDGSELPAHSQILCRFSRVFANMLDDGPLSSASTLNKATLPLTHCSRATAISFLSMLYSPQHFEHIQKNRDSSMAMASLAHKLDMQEIVSLCDDVFSGAAGTTVTERNKAMSASLLQSKDVETFLNLMSSAAQLGMRKALACCEYCIAHDNTGKFNETLQSIPTGVQRVLCNACAGRCFMPQKRCPQKGS